MKPDLESVISLLDYAEETIDEARNGLRDVRLHLNRAEDSLRRMDSAIKVLRQHERRRPCWPWKEI